jgi:prepilin-type N-terminal cleavage/methylation domain-containing protein
MTLRTAVPASFHRDGGFSLIEVMMVVVLIGILAGMVLPVSAGMVTRAKADSSGIEVLTLLEGARNRANSERRNFEVTFNTSTHRVRIERVEPDLTTTVILDQRLSDDMTFKQFSETGDTPDLFGNGTAVDFDGPAPHMFTSDGSLVDANGDPSNGTLFVGKGNHAETARAITVFGTTGLVRAWRFNGREWQQQ